MALIIRTVLAIALLSVLGLADESDVMDTGNKFLDKCASIGDSGPPFTGKLFDGGFCLGYVTGIVQASPAFHENASVFCISSSITTGQAIRVILHYIRENPNAAHQSLNTLSIIALGEAFPCNGDSAEKIKAIKRRMAEGPPLHASKQ